MKILITDDSKMARRMVIKALKEFTSENDVILQANEGKECIEIYKTENPDIVFLDLTMPTMDGFEALKYLKLFDKNAKVIIISADIQKSAYDKVMEDGAFDFIKKPITQDKMKLIFDKIKS
jgi:CheY-like chemotaxis protein